MTGARGPLLCLIGVLMLAGCAAGKLSGSLPGEESSGPIIGDVAAARERARIHTELAGAYYQRGNLGVALSEARMATAAPSLITQISCLLSGQAMYSDRSTSSSVSAKCSWA